MTACLKKEKGNKKMKLYFLILFYIFLSINLIIISGENNISLDSENFSILDSQETLNLKTKNETPVKSSVEETKNTSSLSNQSLPNLPKIEKFLDRNNSLKFPNQINNSNKTSEKIANNQTFSYVDLDLITNLTNATKSTNVSGNLTKNLTETNKDEIQNASFPPARSEKSPGPPTKNTSISLSIKNKTEDSTKNKTKKIKLTLFKNGKKEIEAKLLANSTHEIPNIKKIEKEISEKELWKKEIIVKSETHVNDSFIVYADILPLSEDQKSKIELYWINENKRIPIKDFIDEDRDGLYERISWIVPHLSEQIFEIKINLSTSKSTPNSTLNLTLIKPANNAILTNPLEFEFSINYTDPNSLNCTLFIYNDGGNINYAIPLNLNSSLIALEKSFPDGLYTWYLSCKDKNTSALIKESEIREFKIEENFSLKIKHKVYSLNNDEPIILMLNSRNNATAKIELIKPSGTLLVLNSSLKTPTTLNIPRNEITQPGEYIINATFLNLKKPYSIAENFSLTLLNLSLSKTKLKKGETINITINIESPVETISFYTLKLDGKIIESDIVSKHDLAKTITYTPQESGNFSIVLNALIGERNFSEKRNLEVEEKELKDEKSPTIVLIFPENKEVINRSTITFSFNITDNSSITNCTFEVWNSVNGIGNLKYSEIKENPQKNKNIEITLEDFEDGVYSWNVYCCDNFSNCNYDLEYSRDFTVNISSEDNTAKNSTQNSTQNLPTNTSYEKKEEIEAIIAELDDFYAKKESMSFEDREALKDLGLEKELDYYKKRITQIKQDLESNLRFVGDENVREKRKQEIFEEIENIKSSIPKNFEVLKSYEFVKNTIPKNILEIIKEYFNATKTKIDKGSLKKLSKLNTEIQRYLTVSTTAKQIRIEYPNSSKEITLVTKKIEIKDDNFTEILEVIPKEIVENLSSVKFLNEVKIIKQDPIIKISKENLKEGKLIYYINGLINPEDIKKTDTILFKEFIFETSPLTGFFVFDEINFSSSSLYLTIISLFILVSIYLLSYIIKKMKINKWKKEENVVRIFELVKKAKIDLKNKEQGYAKEKYHKIKELYPLIPPGCKKYLYKDLEKIRIAIDKKDIFDFIKEYENAKLEGRKQDALEIYKNIRKIYQRLPKKYKEKVYERIIKNTVF